MGPYAKSFTPQFFYKKCFSSTQPQCCLTFQCIEPQMLLTFACYIEALSYWGMLYFVYMSLCLRLGLFRSYLCNLFSHFHFHYSQWHNLIDKWKLVFGYVCQNFILRVLFSFCLIFCQIQSGIAYKSVAYKYKTCTIIF